MSSLKILGETLDLIEQTFMGKVSIEVRIQSNTQLRLIEILAEEEIITILGKTNGVLTLKVKLTLIAIDILETPFNTPRRKLVRLTKLLLKSITGIVILSTDKGIMTHLTALERNIGGIVICSIY